MQLYVLCLCRQTTFNTLAAYVSSTHTIYHHLVFPTSTSGDRQVQHLTLCYTYTTATASLHTATAAYAQLMHLASISQ
jgi:hypothetical protein